MSEDADGTTAALRTPTVTSVLDSTDLSAGDVVAADKPHAVRRVPSAAEYMGSLWFGAATLLLYFPRGSGLGWEFVAVWPALLFTFYAVWELVARTSHILGRRLLGALPEAKSLSELGYECALRGVLRRVPGSFDAAYWIDRVGPHGPRVVCLECFIDRTATPPDVYEEIDLATNLKGSRTRLYLAMIPMVLVIIMFTAFGMWSAIRWNMIAAVGLLWSFSLVQLGAMPLPLRAAIVSPGSIVFAGMYFTRGSFAREDTVMVVSRYSNNLVVKFCRRDGKTGNLWFPGGTENVDFQRLLARWCLPAAERRARGPDGAGSDSVIMNTDAGAAG